MESETLELQRKLNKETWDNVALRIRIQGTEDACKVLRGCVERRDKENAELHERLNRENESANRHFMDSKKKDVEIAELKAALVNAGKENKELKDKLSISDFWKNTASNLRAELDRVEKVAATLQKKYDNAVAIGLGYMNQCEKAQSEVEGLKSTVKRMGEKITTLSDDLQLAKARLEYSNSLVDKMGKEKQYLIDQLTCDDNKIAGLQETVGRYAAECSRLNAELVKARQVASPWIITCGSSAGFTIK